MKPVYFPFTYISKPVVDAFSACFQQTIVYQPARFTVTESMQQWAKNGTVELRFPIEGQEERLAGILKNYKDWAKLHTDSHELQNAFIRILHETIPFFNETSVSHIKADIKKDKSQSQHFAEADAVFNARLFLVFAQEFDMENDRLHRDFSSIKAMEKDLFTNLHGLNGEERPFAGKFADNFTGADDTAEYMIEQRFKAWYQVLQFDRKLTDNSGLFITTSRSALAHLLDTVSDAKKIISIDSIPMYRLKSAGIDAWRRQLADQLQQLVKKVGSMKTVNMTAPSADDKFKASTSLQLYIVPAETPLGLFSRCVNPQNPPPDAETRGGQTEPTLIGYLAVNQKI